jgi:RHS repeat-associated protein
VKKLTRKGQQLEVTVYVDGGLFELSYIKLTGTTIDPANHYNTLHVLDGTSRIATVRVGNDANDPTPAIKYYLEDYTSATLSAGLGNSTVALTTTGALVNREEFYPFGETSFGGFGKKRYRYNGKEKDEESGLYNYGQRYYAPWLCGFVSVDPIAEKFPHLSSYNYASNRPITARDLEGLQADNENGGGPKKEGGGISVTDPSNGYLLPEVEVTDIDPSTPETKKGLIGPPVNLSPKQIPNELYPKEESKNDVNKFLKALKWLFVANPISATVVAVFSPVEAGKGSDADT